MSTKSRRKERCGGQVWGERMSEPPDVRVVAYCAGRDVSPRPMADALLVPYDVWQNRAHVLMLARRGIVEPEVAGRILQALDDFEQRWEAGKLTLDPTKEDVHINIEHFVASAIGPHAAGTMHTARSRNDQSATVMRMYVREQLLEFGRKIVELVGEILRRAKEFAGVPVAGMTHYQPASVTTVGHWFGSYAQALVRDAQRVVGAFDRMNISPLGAAASFGTSWPIDRTYTARLLGFDSVQDNTLDCITNRWEMEAEAACCVAFAMTHLSIVAQDLVILSLPRIGIVRLADRHTTGSSIMPQKRNPDFAEVTRAKAVLVQQYLGALYGIARGLVSGYNRDTQWTKYIIMDIFAEAEGAPEVFSAVFQGLSIDRERAMDCVRHDFVDAVDVADRLARELALPFREAYKIVSRAVRECETHGHLRADVLQRILAEQGSGLRCDLSAPEARVLVEAKSHLGGPARSAVSATIQKLEKEVADVRRQLRDRAKKLQRARESVRKQAAALS